MKKNLFSVVGAGAGLAGVGVALLVSGGSVQASAVPNLAALGETSGKPDFASYPQALREAATRGDLGVGMATATSASPRTKIGDVQTQLFSDGQMICLAVVLPEGAAPVSCGPADNLAKTTSAAPIVSADGSGGWYVSGVAGNSAASVRLNGQTSSVVNNTFALHLDSPPTGPMEVLGKGGKAYATVDVTGAAQLPPVRDPRLQKR